MGSGYTYFWGDEALRGVAREIWEMGFEDRVVEEDGVGE
jgi:hypothetical protein